MSTTPSIAQLPTNSLHLGNRGRKDIVELKYTNTESISTCDGKGYKVLNDREK
jgi:hypothetical protein